MFFGCVVLWCLFVVMFDGFGFGFVWWVCFVGYVILVCYSGWLFAVVYVVGYCGGLVCYCRLVVCWVEVLGVFVCCCFCCWMLLGWIRLGGFYGVHFVGRI